MERQTVKLHGPENKPPIEIQVVFLRAIPERVDSFSEFQGWITRLGCHKVIYSMFDFKP